MPYRKREEKTLAEKLPFYALIFFVGALGGMLFYSTFLVSTVASTEPPKPTLALEGVAASRIPVLAVRSDNNEGVFTYVDVEIRPGKERVLINTNPFVEPDTQYSAETAVNISQGYAQTSLKDRDVIITFSADTLLVGGPSAGAAMTIALIAAMKGKMLGNDVAITGTIEANGRIGPVGGVLQKAEAAAKEGVKTFLVPAGESQLQYYEQRVTEQKRGNFVIRRTEYVPKTLDLKQYANETWGLEVKEVRTIDDAAAAFGL